MLKHVFHNDQTTTPCHGTRNSSIPRDSVRVPIFGYPSRAPRHVVPIFETKKGTHFWVPRKRKIGAPADRILEFVDGDFGLNMGELLGQRVTAESVAAGHEDGRDIAHTEILF